MFGCNILSKTFYRPLELNPRLWGRKISRDETRQQTESERQTSDEESREKLLNRAVRHHILAC